MTVGCWEWSRVDWVVVARKVKNEDDGERIKRLLFIVHGGLVHVWWPCGSFREMTLIAPTANSKTLASLRVVNIDTSARTLFRKTWSIRISDSLVEMFTALTRACCR